MPSDTSRPRYFATQGCPPVETRFKPGVSGNPKGRPKGSRSLAELVGKEMDRKITVTADGRSRWLTKRQILARQLVDNAIKGDAKAFTACATIEAANEARKAQTKKTPAETPEISERDDEILRAMIADTPKSDYSVGTTWGFDGASWLLLDLVRDRLLYPELLARVGFERKRWRPDHILVEKTSTGGPLLEDLARDMRGHSEPRYHAPGCQRHAILPRIGKDERLSVAVERLYTGKARFPMGAPWLADLKREMLAFPQATYDDQVDSITQFINWMIGLGGRSAIHRGEPARPR